MEFVLYQFDMAAAAWGATPDEVTLEAARDSSEFSVVRRGLKYLAERTAMRSSAPEFAPAGSPELFRYVEEALFISRMLADVYLASDRAFYILPGEMELELFGADTIIDGVAWPLPYRLMPDKPYEALDVTFTARVVKDRANREKYFPHGTMNLDFQRQAEVLDPAFEESFGCPFSRFLYVIAVINEQAKPDPGSYPVMFFRKEDLVRDVARHGGDSGEDVARRIFAGFTLTREAMMDERRAIYHPNQEHRALRRGYFEFPHSSGVHLFWSSALASESLDHLVNGVCFKKLPKEWLAPETSAGLERLSNEAGKWFEREVAAKLRSLGMRGEGVGGRIIGGGVKIDIPAEVGQFDFLGYSEKDSALVVVESKMVEVGFESRFFRDEISQFVTGKRSYARQLRKKVDWVAANRAAIGRAFGAGSGETKVVSAMVTLYPAYAAFKITDLPCVSLVELMEDYGTKGLWPYSVGIC